MEVEIPRVQIQVELASSSLQTILCALHVHAGQKVAEVADQSRPIVGYKDEACILLIGYG
jgi:hypothetical protein